MINQGQAWVSLKGKCIYIFELVSRGPNECEGRVVGPKVLHVWIIGPLNAKSNIMYALKH